MNSVFDPLEMTVAALDDHPARVLLLGPESLMWPERIRTVLPSSELWTLDRSYELTEAMRPIVHRAIATDPDRPGQFPLPQSYFNAVILGPSFRRSADPASVLTRLRGVLATDGCLISAQPNAAGLEEIRRLAAGEGRDRLSWSVTGFKRLLSEAGFRLVREQRVLSQFRSDTQAIAALTEAFDGRTQGVEEDFKTAGVLTIAKPLKPLVDVKSAQLLGPASLSGVSIVVLTYNSMRTIESCLQSVAATLGPEDELIVVDNASSDGTTGILSGTPGIKAVLNERNLGFSAGTNLGLKQSRGKYLCFLNPDTIVWPGWKERLVARLQTESVGMVGPISDNIAAAQFVGHYLPLAGQSAAQVAAAAAKLHAGRSIETKLVIGLCAMLRRETLDQIGLLDEDLFLGSEDLEISWRLRTHGLKLLVALDTFVHHEGGVSFSSTRSELKKRLLFESTEALLAKVRSAYGWRPPDEDLWGVEICHR